MKVMKITSMVAAAALAVAPTMVSAAQAAPVRAAAPMTDSSELNRTASIALGFLVLLLIGIAAIGGGDDAPVSP